MKYLTKRQRKRRVELFNRFGKICYPIESEAEADDLETTSANRKLPLSTKTIAKEVFKSNNHSQQQQQQPPQPLPDGTNYRRIQFGFGSCSFPTWLERDRERHYHHAEPLTLGSFMDIELLGQLFGEPPLQQLQTPEAETALLPQPQSEPIVSWSQDVSVHELLSHLAITTPYKELATLTLSMLENTAFGPLNTGSSSTADNIPYINYWPNPYQICYRSVNEPDQELVDVMPKSRLKPIGYELQQQQQQEQSPPIMHEFWLRQQYNNNNNNYGNINNMIDKNSTSIVDSIKCICKRNIQWDNWQQCQRYYRKESNWDRRSRFVMANSHIAGQYALPPESAEYQQQMLMPATSAAAGNMNYQTRNNNNNNNYFYKNNNNYNNKNQRFYYQQQQQLDYNYQQQQQQQEQSELQAQQQYWPTKSRPQYHNNRINKANKDCKHFSCIFSNNNINNNNNNNNSNNHIDYHNNCSCNINPFLFNLSQEDLDAAQMYAKYGEIFFDMPMGTQYKASAATAAAAAVGSVATATPNPMPQYQSAGPIDNWQLPTAYMTQNPMPGGVVAPTLPVPAPLTLTQAGQVYSGANLYAANFPPLPAPNQKRDEPY